MLPPAASAALTPAELSTLCRLLDEAMDLPASEADAWLDARPPAQRRLVPYLRDMLAAHRSTRPNPFMADGPRWADAGRDAEVSARPGDTMGPYRLIRQIGRGGMSSVWLADRPDGAVKRCVALKMPLLTLESPAQVERFERERDLLAMLAHPQIARLYDAGVSAAGRPYLVLEHVAGQPITDACDRQRLDLPARLRLFLQVLAAVDHAHRHLVVHRDIKPSNVFVDDDGQVRLLDFGIAKLLGDPAGTGADTALTRDFGCALTPRYAAPEQIDGRPISTATDVYSLGVLLYELLCGALPHDLARASMADAVHAALHADPPRPSRVPIGAAAAASRRLRHPEQVRSQLAGDLDTIVLKALRKAPAERYASVERFAEDVQRYLDHRPIGARPPGWAHRARLWVSRHRGASLAAALGLAAASAFAGAAWNQHLQGVQERERAEAVRDFMLNLVDDAEPDEHHPGVDPTGSRMVAGAVQRARSGFAGQPRLRGELLADLGRMQYRLGDAASASGVLDEALELLAANAPAGDAALNKARAHRADVLLDEGRIDAAESLARAAAQRCIDGSRCAKARQCAHQVLGKVELRRGRPDRAAQQMLKAVDDAAEAFGPRHSETALTLLSLAIVERQAGDLNAARAALDRALDLGRDATLRQADRVDLLRTQAVLSFDFGDYADARDRLLALLARTPPGAERAQQQRLLANTLLALGDPDAALDASASALALATAAKDDIEAVLAHQAHARALSLTGAAAGAAAEMRAVVQGWRDAGYAESAMEVLRARRMLAEIAVRGGDTGAGPLTELEAVAASQSSSAGGQPLEWATTLDLIGSLHRQAGRAAQARELHRQAGRVFAEKLPPGHPLRTRNALYLAAASAPETAARAPNAARGGPGSGTGPGTGPGSAPDDSLTRAAEAYRQRFSASSVWRRTLDRYLAGDACSAGPAKACALIL